MRLSRASLPTVLIVLAALILTACAGQQGQASQSVEATRAATAEATAEDTPEATPSPTDEESAEPSDEESESAEPSESEDDGQSGGDGDYVQLEHDNAEMRVEVPSDWTDTDTNDTWAVNDGEDVIGYSLIASTDIDSFLGLQYEAPGVFFAASATAVDQYTPDSLLDEYDLGDCTPGEREDYSDPVYTGRQDFYTDCDGTDAQFMFIAAEADDGSHIVLVQVSALTDEDMDAYDRIVETFIARELPPVE